MDLPLKNRYRYKILFVPKFMKQTYRELRLTFRLFKLFAALSFAILAVGCVQAPKKQAFNAAANSSIKEIVIAHNINQDEYPAIVIAHPGINFGLIGGLIAAADMHSKSTRLTQALNVSETDRKSTRLNSSHSTLSRMPSSA